MKYLKRSLMNLFRSLFVFLFFTAPCFCQPVLTSSNGFFNGAILNFYVNTSPALDEGAGGTNQVWDFSSLSSTDPPASYTAVDASQTPFSTDFPSANVAAISTDFSGTAVYSYFTNSPGIYSNQGYESISGALNFSDPIDILHFPFAYGDNFSDHYSGTTNTGDENFGAVQLVADGYGTILLPTGSFGNCLRVREVRRDTFISATSSIGTTNDTSYKFYVVGYPEPVCQVNYHHAIFDGSNFDFFEIYWQDVLESGITESRKDQDLVLIPNPCEDVIVLKNVSPDVSAIRIINLQGQEVKVETIASGMQRLINTSGLANGSYYLQVKDKNSTSRHAFIKISSH